MAEDTVQTYLTKHKISPLFEELMSKIVKELPPDPVDFLIKKLQILHRQKNKGPSIGPPKASRGRIEVTGTSVTSKTPTNTKSPISDRLSKSTSGLRPVKPRSTLSSSSAASLSKTTPTRPHTTSRPVGGSGAKTSSKIPTASAIKTKPSSTSKPASRIPSATRTPTRPSTAPVAGGKSSSSTPSAGRTKAAAKPSSIPTSGKKPVGKASTLSSSKLASSSSPSVKSLPKQEPRIAGKEVGVTTPASAQRQEVKVEKIAEFFGEPKKSSQRQFFVDSDEEGSGDEGLESDSDSDGVDHVSDSKYCDSGINVRDIVKRRCCKHAKKSRGANRRLPVVISNSSTPLSLGYDDDTESGDSDVGGVELLEDPDALKDEGVEVARSNYTITKSSVAPEMLEVVVCARCAKALGKSEQCVVTGMEFESASQVGSHTSYPQWGSEGSSSVGLGAVISGHEGDLETSSDVTLESHDTWGGLAPAPPQPLLSEEESEIQLPPPPPLQGQTWMSQTPPQDAHGWGQHEN